MEKTLLNKIKKEAIRIDWEVTFNGNTKGNHHLERVNKIAKHLAKEENANLELSQAGAWLHDVALSTGSDYDLDNSKKVAKQILKQLEVKIPEERRIVMECIISHEGVKQPTCLEAKVVHDADVLDKLGVLGFIRHTVKLTNLGWIKPGDIRRSKVKEMVDHLHWRETNLKLKESKRLAKFLRLKGSRKEIYFQAEVLINTISPLAKEGVLTEKIAKIIASKLKPQWRDVLDKQLNLDYLKNLIII